MLRNFQAHDKVEAAVHVERLVQVVRGKSVDWYEEASSVHVIAVNADHLGNPVGKKGCSPCPDTAADVKHRAGRQQAEKKWDHFHSGPKRLLELGIEEFSTVRACLDIPESHGWKSASTRLGWLECARGMADWVKVATYSVVIDEQMPERQ